MSDANGIHKPLATYRIRPTHSHKVTLISSKQITEADWGQYVDSIPHATFFDHPIWYQFWADYDSLNHVAHLLDLDSGKQVLFACRLLPNKTGKRIHANSSAAGTFGGFLSKDSLTASDLDILAGWLKKQKFHSYSFRTNPYTPGMEVLPGIKKLIVSEDFTQAINLSDGFESCFKKWTKGHRSAAKKGMRDGVTVRQANCDKDWADYFDAYQDSIARWGDTASSVYRKELFETFSRDESEKVKLWIAEFDNRLISGCLCFYHNQHVVYWHGASVEEALSLKGVHVLQYHIIQDAATKKYRWYDFNPSGGHSGVVHFKNGFAAEKLPTYVVRPKQPLMNVARKIKRGFNGILGNKP